uniref:Uncharacterized protein n=1 Tax=Globodera rostochiensis TaxID=31243 RepID=A0A914H031_GLORO
MDLKLSVYHYKHCINSNAGDLGDLDLSPLDENGRTGLIGGPRSGGVAGGERLPGPNQQILSKPPLEGFPFRANPTPAHPTDPFTPSTVSVRRT